MLALDGETFQMIALVGIATIVLAAWFIALLLSSAGSPMRQMLRSRYQALRLARVRGSFPAARRLQQVGDLLGPSFRVVGDASPLLLTGSLEDGRAAAVEFYTTEPTATEHDVRIRVALHRGVPPLELTRPMWRSGIADRVWPPGVEVDEAHEPAAVRALQKLFDTLEVDRIRVIEGELIASHTWRAGRWTHWATAVELLADVARALEPALRVAVKTADPATHPDARVRCAYCHEDLKPDEPETKKCERCGTVLHAGCWEELGRCPVLGCVGGPRAGERVH